MSEQENATPSSLIDCEDDDLIAVVDEPTIMDLMSDIDFDQIVPESEVRIAADR